MFVGQHVCGVDGWRPCSSLEWTIGGPAAAWGLHGLFAAGGPTEVGRQCGLDTPAAVGGAVMEVIDSITRPG